MKKIALSLIALAAVSTAALADRNNDLRDQDTYWGKFANSTVSAEALPVLMTNKDGVIMYGRYGSSTDGQEIRRWDEKNG